MKSELETRLRSSCVNQNVLTAVFVWHLMLAMGIDVTWNDNNNAKPSNEYKTRQDNVIGQIFRTSFSHSIWHYVNWYERQIDVWHAARISLGFWVVFGVHRNGCGNRYISHLLHQQSADWERTYKMRNKWIFVSKCNQLGDAYRWRMG